MVYIIQNVHIATALEIEDISRDINTIYIMVCTVVMCAVYTANLQNTAQYKLQSMERLLQNVHVKYSI